MLEGMDGGPHLLHPNEGEFMRTRIWFIAAILVTTTFALAGVAAAQETDAPGIGQLVQSFLNADQTGDVVTANVPMPYRPSVDRASSPATRST